MGAGKGLEMGGGGPGLAVQLIWLILGSGDQSQYGAIGGMEERLEAKMGGHGAGLSASHTLIVFFWNLFDTLPHSQGPWVG